MRKKKLILFIIGLGLLTALLATTEWNTVVDTFRILSPMQILVLVLMQLLTILLISTQWWSVASHLGMKLSLLRIIEMNMAGTFFESVTPAVKTGGEAYKVYYLRQRGESVPRGSALVAAQKIISFLAFMGVTILAFLVVAFTRGGYEGTNGIFLRLLAGFALFLALILLIGAFFLRKKEISPSKSRFKNKLASLQDEFKTTLRPLKGKPEKHCIHFALGFMIWSLYGLKTFYLVHSFGFDLSVFESALVTFSAYIVALIPFTPGGLGTFEGTFYLLMPRFGMAAGAAMAIALTLRLVTFWFQLALSTMVMVFIGREKVGAVHDTKTV